MDIKNIFKVSPLAFLYQSKINKSQQLKTDSTTDRDANGQMPFSQKQKQKFNNIDEFHEAIERLKKLPPVLEHHWSIHIVQSPPLPAIVHLKDSLGNIIKILDEPELASLLDQPIPHKGQLIKKTA